jgi:hypothetical protein
MLEAVFQQLASDEFQDVGGGLMSFPAYVYVYPPEREYAFREAVEGLCNRLRRSNVGQDPLLVSVFDEFLAFLEAETLGGKPVLDYIHDQETDDPEKIDRQLKEHARSDEFAQWMAERFEGHVTGDSDLRRTYVLVHGWGAIHPYLRSSRLLDRMEGKVGDYKMILFYPGTYENGRFRLFGQLTSTRVYRASCLNEMIES